MRLKLLVTAAALTVAPMAFAGQFSLNGWCFYVNSLDLNHSCSEGSASGSISSPFQNISFDTTLGAGNTLGSVQTTLGSGTYNVFAFWDYNSSGSFSDYASTIGSLPAGVTYSVDAAGDPSSGGSVTPYTSGNLWDSFAAGALDNTNHLPTCSAGGSCEDVAVAMGYSVNVPSGQTETLTFTVGSTPPASGFYISQSSADGGGTIYFSSNVTPGSGGGSMVGIENAVPEPATLTLLAGGLGLLLFTRRRRTV